MELSQSVKMVRNVAATFGGGGGGWGGGGGSAGGGGVVCLFCLVSAVFQFPPVLKTMAYLHLISVFFLSLSSPCSSWTFYFILFYGTIR